MRRELERVVNCKIARYSPRVFCVSEIHLTQNPQNTLPKKSWYLVYSHAMGNIPGGSAGGN